jgi:hypothetical protein
MSILYRAVLGDATSTTSPEAARSPGAMFAGATVLMKRPISCGAGQGRAGPPKRLEFGWRCPGRLRAVSILRRGAQIFERGLPLIRVQAALELPIARHRARRATADY